MNLKKLLFAAGLCVGANVYAQLVTNSLSPLSVKLEPRLHAVKNTCLPEEKQIFAEECAAGNILPMKNNMFRYAPNSSAAAEKEKLDSIVTKESDGKNVALQSFIYGSNGKETGRRYYYWDFSSKSWGEPVEKYDYVWNEDELVVSEQAVGYGSGQRIEYKYNGRGLGIEQITYRLDTDGKWVEVSKGVYDYDDNGNIIEESLSEWNGSQWVETVRNFASWDAKKRQTGFTGYAWDGRQWTGTGKGVYVWFDGPYDPEYVEGTNKERMTLKVDYLWIDGEYKPFYLFTNDFNSEGRLAGQSEKYYNRQSKKWCGGDSWDGMIGNPMTWKGVKTYDEHGAVILDETWKCLPDSTGWLKLASNPTEWVYDEAGNREGLYKLITYAYDENNNKIGENFTQQTHYGYNADNKRIWLKEELVDEEGKAQTLFEEKYGYDEHGRHIYSMIWDWVDGKRRPSSRTVLTYNENGEMIESLSYSGDNGMIPMGAPAMRGAEVTADDEEGWVKTARWTYAYENGIVIDKRGYMWRDGEWKTNTGQSVSYDFSTPSADVFFPEGWKDPYKINTIDDLSGDGSTGWVSATRYYYYSDINSTGISGLPADNADNVSIKCDGGMLYVTSPGNVTIDIFDVSGTHVRKVSGSAAYIGDLPSGVYVVAAGGGKMKILKK